MELELFFIASVLILFVYRRRGRRESVAQRTAIKASTATKGRPADVRGIGKNAGLFTTYLDYPIFSICKSLIKVRSDSSKATECILASGGGGGIEYGIADRLEVFEFQQASKTKSEESNPWTTRASHILLGVVDDIKYNQKLNYFAGGNLRDCVLYKLIESESYLTEISRWVTVEDSPRSREKRVQERCAISPDGCAVATAGEDGRIMVYRLSFNDRGALTQRSQVAEFRGDCAQGITQLSFSPDNSLLFATSRSGYLSIFGPFASSHDAAKLLLKTPVSLGSLVPKGRPVVPRSFEWLENRNPDEYTVLLTGFSSGPATSYLTKVMIRKQSPDGYGQQPKLHVEFGHTVPQTGCPMFNCMALSDDQSQVAVVSNQWIYIFSTENLNCLLVTPRSAVPGADMPATGCAFIDNDRKIVVSAGDFSISTLDVQAARRARSHLRSAGRGVVRMLGLLFDTCFALLCSLVVLGFVLAIFSVHAPVTTGNVRPEDFIVYSHSDNALKGGPLWAQIAFGSLQVLWKSNGLAPSHRV